MNKKVYKKLILLDIILSFILIMLLFFLSPDYVLIGASFLIALYMILSKRKVLLYHLVVSFIIAILWIVIANDYYNYNKDFLVISGFNVYPIFAWGVGLFVAYLIYIHYEHLVKKRNFTLHISMFTIMFWILLIVAEIIGYHFLGIHNLATQNYSAMSFCNCLHAPLWMKTSYFLIGPLFFIICYLMKIENPHQI